MHRVFFIVASFFYVCYGHQASGAKFPVNPQTHVTAGSEELVEDVIIGKPDSLPVFVYASFACGHCADLHKETVPLLQEKYVQAGKIHLIFRDFPLDKISLQASLIARSGGQGLYQKLAHQIWEKQNQWIDAKDPLAILKDIARGLGVTSEKIEDALNDKALEAKILNRCIEGYKVFKIDGTPTIVVGDKEDNVKFDYAAKFSQLSEAINKKIALPRATVATQK